MSAVIKPEATITDEVYAALIERAAALGMHKPDPVPPDQAWFSTPAWGAGEIEASEQIAAGRITRYMSTEEFLTSPAEEGTTLVPTFDKAPGFREDYRALHMKQREAFRVAARKLVDDLRQGELRTGLRDKGVQRLVGDWEMTWADDGRATFE